MLDDLGIFNIEIWRRLETFIPFRPFASDFVRNYFRCLGVIFQSQENDALISHSLLQFLLQSSHF